MRHRRGDGHLDHLPQTLRTGRNGLFGRFSTVERLAVQVFVTSSTVAHSPYYGARKRPNRPFRPGTSFMNLLCNTEQLAEMDDSDGFLRSRQTLLIRGAT